MNEYFQIELTQGQVAQVSADDFEELSQYEWHAHWSKNSKSFYASRSGYYEDGTPTTIKMHRQILGFPAGLLIDHINGDTLDNRRANIRVATHTENQRNRRMNSNNKSGFKGVSKPKYSKHWKASIRVEGKPIKLGDFDTAEQAYKAYCVAAEQHFGEFKRLA